MTLASEALAPSYYSVVLLQDYVYSFACQYYLLSHIEDILSTVTSLRSQYPHEEQFKAAIVTYKEGRKLLVSQRRKVRICCSCYPRFYQLKITAQIFLILEDWASSRDKVRELELKRVRKERIDEYVVQRLGALPFG